MVRRFLSGCLSVVVSCIVLALPVTSPGCKPAGPAALPINPPATVFSAKEHYMSEDLTQVIDDGGPFVEGKDASVTKILFSRGYGFVDKNMEGVKAGPVNIFEKVHVHTNTGSGITLETLAVRITSSNKDGIFGDQPDFHKEGFDLPDTFDFSLTRVLYVKRNGAKVPIVANYYNFKREQGDGVAQVRMKSKMADMYMPMSIDDVQNRDVLFAKDSGE